MAKIADILPLDQVAKLAKLRNQLANRALRAKLAERDREREAHTVDAHRFTVHDLREVP